jgi:tetratricopeptide (TPR) repeat protein
MLEKALALDSSLAVAHYEVGKRLLERGKAAEALPHFEKAARRHPYSSRTRFTLANAYRLAGRAEDQARELKVYRKLKARQR